MKKNIITLILVVSLLLLSIPVLAEGLPGGVLRQGSRGRGVSDLQKALNKTGYHIAVDGIYGRATKSSVLDLQKKYKELGNDGIYGPATKRVMEALINPGGDKNSGENGKIAYLTFDDGPSTTNTPKILDTLDQYGVKATFFVLGDMAEKSPDIVKRIHSEGHSIGNHSYSHRYDYLYKNMDNFLGEINRTDRVLKNILGEEFNTNLLRFPGGSFESYKDKYIKAAEKLGYKIYDWNALNGDSESRNPSVGKLVNRLKETTKGQNKLIVLMHDNYGKENTVQALPSIIDYLINQGYKFNSLDE